MYKAGDLAGRRLIRKEKRLKEKLVGRKCLLFGERGLKKELKERRPRIQTLLGEGTRRAGTIGRTEKKGEKKKSIREDSRMGGKS